MLKEKKQSHEIKNKLHPRNKNRERYNFAELIAVSPELADFTAPNIYGDNSIDFANPTAVKLLNQAILKLNYGIENWDIPNGFLCPPIPGRADYLHYIADLLASKNGGKIPTGKLVTCLDIGVGANCIYPIIGNKEYNWNFIGTDIDEISIANAAQIVQSNPHLKNSIELRSQKNSEHIFRGIIRDEFIDVSICNPPFHSSQADAIAAASKKVSNLKQKKIKNPTLNFGGKSNELWCEGGEEMFVSKMVAESREFWNSCFWFTSLISKQTHLKKIYSAINTAKATEVKTIEMGQGNKISRIVAWTFLNEKQQKSWRDLRWNRKM
ncbi:MAG: 23S rRNA (adenine(1618)-N(6))-methyltransferase RlmF [Pyrinomonadaceae bacterium]|nr:23S rRNA (adenine(1618)-N(6))-methyltransferase RlmF [Pyrinomonadaceae bacterium]